MGSGSVSTSVRSSVPLLPRAPAAQRALALDFAVGPVATALPEAGEAERVVPPPGPPVALDRPVETVAGAVAGAGPASALCLERLHPSLWFGHQLARHGDAAVETGFAELDAQLPGGGWPRRALTELLLPQPGIGEIRLVAHSLVQTQGRGRLVMLFDPPAALSAVALEQLGFDVAELLVIHTRARVVPGTDSLWALEQALKSGHVGAVLAWLPPRLRAERVRRLQLAAHAHDGPAFVFGDLGAAQRPTAAPLRLALKPAEADRLAVRLLKRRGPLLERPLLLALPPVLSTVARQRARPVEPSARGGPHPVAARRSADGETASRLDGATFIDLAAASAAAHRSGPG